VRIGRRLGFLMAYDARGAASRAESEVRAPAGRAVKSRTEKKKIVMGNAVGLTSERRG